MPLLKAQNGLVLMDGVISQLKECTLLFHYCSPEQIDSGHFKEKYSLTKVKV